MADRKLISKTLPLLAFAAALSGCDMGASPLAQLSGHYEGALTTHLDGKTYTQVAVQTDIGADVHNGKQPVTVAAENPAAAATLAAPVTLDVRPGKGAATVVFRSSLGMADSMVLKLDADRMCYVGATDALKIRFCVSHPELSVEIESVASKSSLLALVLHPFRVGDAAVVNETPQAFTLDQAIERAKTKSFESRIEFEHVIQAKARSKAAYLHLLPQLTFSTIVNNITPTWQSLLAAIGDLAPFLLPTRWFQTQVASNQKKAEQDAYTLMRLTMAAQAEGMFYGYARDDASRALTKELLAKAIKIRNEVKIRENAGGLTEGSTANMNSIVNQVQQNLSVLEQVTAEDLASIAQTLGYFMPTTVTDAVIGTELVPIEQAQKLDFKTVNDEVLKRAIELDQMDYLIKAAKETKSASYFSWIDPYGDPALGLGFALPSQVTVLGSQVHELEIDKEQLQSVISQRVFDAVTDQAQALDSFKIGMDGMAIQRTRLDTELTQLETGYNVDFFGLLGILQDYLNAEILLETARANYRVARSEIDRLLLQGNYSKF